MHGMIAWFARNHVAANLMMIAILAMGVYSMLKRMPLEVFPAFELDVINISTSYPGASPSEVEKGIVQPIEEALSDLPDIQHIYAEAREGGSGVRLEINDGYDLDKTLNEIKSRVDGITSFPNDVERPVINSLIRSRENITVMVTGELDEKQLHELTLQIRDEILNLPEITQVATLGLRPYEISIEVSEDSLQRYGLSFENIAQSVNQASQDIPAGSIETAGGEILVRTLGEAATVDDFANIPVRSHTDGSLLRLGDIATIVDGFNDKPLYILFNGERAAGIAVYRIGDQSAIKISKAIKNYIKTRNDQLSSNVELIYWRDNSRIIKARLQTLLNSAYVGIFLIFILLAMFLKPSVALWVSIGIPISFMGAITLLPWFDVTFNLISVFAFIVVLGIVVDDAIVTGENIYSHLGKRINGKPKPALQAAIEGTQEVSIPVTFGVLTTVTAFIPLLMIDGLRGKIFAQIPLVVIPVLLMSLIESKLILPAHMSSVRYKEHSRNLLLRFQQGIARSLERFIEVIYQPTLKAVLKMRYFSLAIFISILFLSVLIVMAGHFKYTFFPRVQSEFARAMLVMPEGTPIETTARHTDHIQRQLLSLQDKYREPDGKSIIRNIMVTIGSTGGSHRGLSRGQSNRSRVQFEIISPEQRVLDITSSELVREWRKMIGGIPGAQDLTFRAEIGRGGDPVDIQLSGHDFGELSAAAEKIKIQLANYDGVFDIKDSFEGGKDEIHIRIRDDAKLLGLNISGIGRQVRDALFGKEIQKIQRNNDEIPVVLRLPEAERQSIHSLDSLHIRTSDSREIRLKEAAHVSISEGYSKISRTDRKRVVNVTADINKEEVDTNLLNREMQQWLPEILAEYPNLGYSLEGEQREQGETTSSLLFGLLFALLGIYTLLAIPFRSYIQPFIVMGVIPFSMIGALGGHAIMGMSLSISSMLGLLALTGVVVNDSLVLVDYINRRRREGIELFEALSIAGTARFRPILLTSLTTFAGLLPLMFEKSTQAQFLIPMAISLGFGILFATLITLFLVPVSYLILEDIKRIIYKALTSLFKVWHLIFD